MESFGKNADVVLAVDILPYLPPMSLQKTMEKIRCALKDGGLIIGTLFTQLGDEPSNRDLQSLLEQLGAHFYPDRSSFVAQFLKASGFAVVKLEKRVDCGFRFIAQKLDDTPA